MQLLPFHNYHQLKYIRLPIVSDLSMH